MSSVASADIEALTQALQEASHNAEVTTQGVLVNAANYIKAEMEQRVPVRTGKLRQSIAIKVENEKVTIGPNTEYDEFVEFGTRPHKITAKNKKALSFTVGGTKVVVKSVNHPGTRAKPYVRPAFEAWVDTLGQLAAEANIKRIEQGLK